VGRRAGLSERDLAVARHLLVHGPSSRGDLGELLQLSYASMSRTARSLVDDGIVSEQVEEEPGVGRPRRILSAVPSARHVVGCKLTGTTAYGVVCDMSGAVCAKSRAALPPPADGAVPLDGVVRAVAGLVRRLGRDVPSLDGLGVSVGGIVRERSFVQEGTFLGWHDVDLATPLTARSGLPVIVSNDVAALAREQLWFGAGRTHSTFAVVTVGAGIGYGLVREGVVVDELVDNGHLLLHAPLDPRGPRCPAGHRGCVSAYLDRSSLAARTGHVPGHPMDLRALGKARDDGNKTAARLLDEAARALGHLVATAAGSLQTTRVVLAGEDVSLLAESAALQKVVADRLRPGQGESMHCDLDLSTEPLTFTDWARGAAVTGIQHALGAR